MTPKERRENTRSNIQVAVGLFGLCLTLVNSCWLTYNQVQTNLKQQESERQMQLLRTRQHFALNKVGFELGKKLATISYVAFSNPKIVDLQDLSDPVFDASGYEDMMSVLHVKDSIDEEMTNLIKDERAWGIPNEQDKEDGPVDVATEDKIFDNAKKLNQRIYHAIDINGNRDAANWFKFGFDLRITDYSFRGRNKNLFEAVLQDCKMLMPRVHIGTGPGSEVDLIGTDLKAIAFLSQYEDVPQINYDGLSPLE